MPLTHEISNRAYRLSVGIASENVDIRLHDLAMDFVWSDAPYKFRLGTPCGQGTLHWERLGSVLVEPQAQAITIRAQLAGLEWEQRFELPLDKPFLEERIALHNRSDRIIELTDLEVGMLSRVADSMGQVLPTVATDRIVAIPFRKRPNDPTGFVNDFAVSDLLTRTGNEMRFDDKQQAYWNVPSRHRWSEGWAWTHDTHTLGVFKFNQEAMEFSVLSTHVADDGVFLRFGGACLISSQPSALRRIPPGGTVQLGVTRYQTVEGDYREAMYAFRAALDEHGCRFPADYNPPVHWNELYDNPEWSISSPGKPAQRRGTLRARTYTRALIQQEAQKAQAYHCEALYLDPGWDTEFGSFKWGEPWLGPPRRFISDMKEGYGLDVALHCPLATWTSAPWFREMYQHIVDWPRESFRMAADGTTVEDSVCLGSRQYLDEATRRLHALCAEGVAFLMFDGNWWNGGCWNPNHGHPVPYTWEDHIRANVDLAQRVHKEYPRVLIEMHDMLVGGARARPTPVYYKYGLPGSYDENWGFELMWNPIDDLREGRAQALYYYNLGCNVPLYLHIDLRGDNEHCVVFWWFASTCRHLGIGGTHANPSISAAQKHAMARYRAFERFFKRGEFIGLSEEIHLHVLPQENAFVMNVFNLSDQPRRIESSLPLERIGVARDRWYTRSADWGRFDALRGVFEVHCPLPPWGTQLVEFRALGEN